MAKFIDNCRFTPTAGGTSDWTYSAAVSGSQSPTAAGAIDGQTYRYAAYSADLSQWEIGYGAYTSSSGVFARTTVLYNSSGTTSKINFSAAPTVGIVPLGTDFREKLDANRTYYVRTDGSDSNNGLANTSGGAFLTIQKAIDVVASIDLSIYDVTIQVADGTYTGAIVVDGPWVGLGSVTLKGNTSTPTNVVVTASGAHTLTVQNNGVLYTDSFQIKSDTTGSQYHAILSQYGGTVYWSGLDFGACGNAQVRAGDGGKAINIGNNYTISAGAIYHFDASSLGEIRCQTNTVTLSGTPAYSTAFARAVGNAVVNAASITFSGSATGTRYSATLNGVINVAGGGANYFPGNAAGSTATGGQYA